MRNRCHVRLIRATLEINTQVANLTLNSYMAVFFALGETGETFTYCDQIRGRFVVFRMMCGDKEALHLQLVGGIIGWRIDISQLPVQCGARVASGSSLQVV